MAKRKFERPQAVRQKATIKEKEKEVSYEVRGGLKEVKLDEIYTTSNNEEVMKLQKRFVCMSVTGGEGGGKNYTFDCSPAEAKEYLGGDE